MTDLSHKPGSMEKWRVDFAVHLNLKGRKRIALFKPRRESRFDQLNDR